MAEHPTDLQIVQTSEFNCCSESNGSLSATSGVGHHNFVESQTKTKKIDH